MTHVCDSFVRLICATHLCDSFVRLICVTHLCDSFVELICATHLCDSFVELICVTHLCMTHLCNSNCAWLICGTHLWVKLPTYIMSLDQYRFTSIDVSRAPSLMTSHWWKYKVPLSSPVAWLSLDSEGSQNEEEWSQWTLALTGKKILVVILTKWTNYLLVALMKWTNYLLVVLMPAK